MEKKYVCNVCDEDICIVHEKDTYCECGGKFIEYDFNKSYQRGIFKRYLDPGDAKSVGVYKSFHRWLHSYGLTGLDFRIKKTDGGKYILIVEGDEGTKGNVFVIHSNSKYMIRLPENLEIDQVSGSFVLANFKPGLIYHRIIGTYRKYLFGWGKWTPEQKQEFCDSQNNYSGGSGTPGMIDLSMNYLESLPAKDIPSNDELKILAKHVLEEELRYGKKWKDEFNQSMEEYAISISGFD